MTLASTILRAPVDRRSTGEAAYLAATLPSAIGAFMLALAALAACLALVVGVGLPLLVGVLALARESGTLFRRPARATLGWTWSPPEPLASRGRVRRAGALLRDGVAWRSLLYCALKLPLTAVGVYGGLVGYVVGALGATYPLWWFVAHEASWPYGHRPWTGTWLLALQGAALLLIAPWFVRLVVTIDHALVNRLLAPNPLGLASQPWRKAAPPSQRTPPRRSSGSSGISTTEPRPGWSHWVSPSRGSKPG